jgi:Zn-dependent oligopeptidase
LQPYDLPPFSAIRAEHVQPAIEQILADNRAAIIEILKPRANKPTWAGLVLAMDELNDRLAPPGARSATSTPCATAPNCARPTSPACRP